jgi:glucose-6-phosphate 1-dehydrogenase
MSTSSTDAALDIVIFGGAGDLSFRKLLPALYMAHAHDRLDAQTRILAVGRQAWSTEDYLQFIDQRSPEFIDPTSFDPDTWQAFLKRLSYVGVDVTSAPAYAALQAACPTPRLRVFYLATAPSLFSQICAHLHGVGLVDALSRVVLEKPLGTDLASARAINQDVAKYFGEQQIYRIDHYLGKETVQNLMVLRFGNAIFEPLWRAPYIKSVQITVAETVGVGSRAGFYDGAGAMRDMVQNHLLQLLCIVAMEQPISLDADDVRDEKLKVLRSLRRMGLADIKRDTVRGQYTAGSSEGQAVTGYLEEDNVPPDSRTETFVALRAQINNARWAQVPFFLRTG